MNQHKKAVIYCRVSTKEQVEEGNSLVSQERICRTYAEKYNYDLAEIFIEMGESAKTADRTELKRLLSFCSKKTNSINAVIVYKIDRLSRNTDDYGQIRLFLRKYGVDIKSATEHFEDNPMGRFMENIIANVAQFDNDMRTERSVGGMRDAVRDGRYVWNAPVGYSNVKVDGKSTIAPSDMAPLVQEAFTRVGEGIQTTEEIRELMTKKGFLNKQGKPFSRSYFYTMLHNEVYIGIIKKFGETHRGLFSPIVDELTFKQVHYVLHGPEIKHTRYKIEHPDFPLRRLIRNPEGFKLTGGWCQGRCKKYPYYRFMNGGSFARDKFEKKFVVFMNSFGLGKTDVHHLKEILSNGTSKSDIEIQKDILHLQSKIHELNNQQDVLIKKNFTGIIPDAVLQYRLGIIDQEQTQLQSVITHLKKERREKIEVNINESFFTHPGNIWAASDLYMKRKLVLFLFPSGLIYNDQSFKAEKVASLFRYTEELSQHLQLGAVPKYEMVKEHKALRQIFEPQVI